MYNTIYSLINTIGGVRQNGKWLLMMWLVLCFVSVVKAQNGTCSPYSAFAFGEINDNVPNTLRGMGGVGLGLRNNKVINPMQPASYTAGDSLTFMFDVAAGVSWSMYSDATGRRNRANGNLEYLSLQFPLWKRYIALSAGVLPYTSKGYDITLSDSINSDYHYTMTHEGSGGISEIYAGLSFNICNWAALGANFYYMFGEQENLRSLSFSEAGLTSVSYGEYLNVSSVRMRYGLQLFHTFGKHSIVLGGIFENKTTLHSDLTVLESTYADTIFSNEDSDEVAYQTPMVYGAGFSYTWNNRLTLAFDYMCQQWADTKYLNLVQKDGEYTGETVTGALRNRERYAFGIEYRNDPLGRRYVDRVMWRAGANVVRSYITDVTQPEFTVSIGVGLPLRTVGTVFNASVEYTHRSGLLEENMLKLTINAAIAESWFFKRKL